MISQGQSVNKLKLVGNYSSRDSVRITRAYLSANLAVEHMYKAMNEIWTAERTSGQSKKLQRKLLWENDVDFMTWLGGSTNIGKARRKIKKMNSKFQRRFTLEVTKEDEGRCSRFVSAWAIPYGKVKIRLCRNFVNFGPHNQEKVIIHELAHEAGILFDRGVYRCGTAKSIAKSSRKNLAKRTPENYAWLAMSYLGVECRSRSRSR